MAVPMTTTTSKDGMKQQQQQQQHGNDDEQHGADGDGHARIKDPPSTAGHSTVNDDDDGPVMDNDENDNPLMDGHNRPQDTQRNDSDDELLPPASLSCLEWMAKYRTLLESAGKAAALFIFCLVFLVVLLRQLLPPIDPADRPAVKIPKSFDELKRLNEVLQIYKDRNFGRVLGSFVALYLFLQAYSLPGSMYLSILAGAMYGVAFALPLVCACVATGATLCYLISALLGPALLLASKRWRDRLEVWRERIRNQGGNMISYLIVLRIAPLPPHWVVNMVCPHLNISIPLFWISTFFGVMAVSFIHVQIGTTLEEMGSPKDFHLISWRNFFGLAGVVIGVMVPVALRYYWKQELEEAAGLGDGVVLPADREDDENSPSDADPDGDIHIVVHQDDQVDVYKENRTPAAVTAPEEGTFRV